MFLVRHNTSKQSPTANSRWFVQQEEEETNEDGTEASRSSHHYYCSDDSFNTDGWRPSAAFVVSSPYPSNSPEDVLGRQADTTNAHAAGLKRSLSSNSNSSGLGAGSNQSSGLKSPSSDLSTPPLSSTKQFKAAVHYLENLIETQIDREEECYLSLITARDQILECLDQCRIQQDGPCKPTATSKKRLMNAVNTYKTVKARQVTLERIVLKLEQLLQTVVEGRDRHKLQQYQQHAHEIQNMSPVQPIYLDFNLDYTTLMIVLRHMIKLDSYHLRDAAQTPRVVSK